jgi:glycerate-2-kinase
MKRRRGVDGNTGNKGGKIKGERRKRIREKERGEREQALEKV